MHKKVYKINKTWYEFSIVGGMKSVHFSALVPEYLVGQSWKSLIMQSKDGFFLPFYFTIKCLNPQKQNGPMDRA